ncbi:HNH endonuclease [Rhodococcus sp. T9N]|uniref:HNH endonuclease n=1 Tax=Rhodococcus sp. T9N TaxID=627445 RepID=UPI0021C39A0A|nr:HNH endonuclease [Rhodococcus sp. T9N]
MKIFERDRWQCHICNTRVKRDMVVPHPLAPTIDHLIPLAAGGTHEPANVATAHFLCNSRKGDRGAGEQLALIG